MVTELQDFVSINIDAESEAGTKVAQRYGVKGYPALLVLETDGKVRDQIGGYLKPDDFKSEIRRVRADQGTVGEARRKVAAEPKSPDARWRLVEKLRGVGEIEAAKAEIAEIEKLDPEGKSLGMRHVLFERVIERIDQGWQRNQSLDTAELERFLAEEQHAEILFNGWQRMYSMRSYQAQAGPADQAKGLRADARRSLAAAWKHCPPADHGRFGPACVVLLWNDRADLDEGERKLALEIADAAVAAAKDDPNAIGARARALYLVGKKEEALAEADRLIALDPKNAAWTKLRAGLVAG